MIRELNVDQQKCIRCRQCLDFCYTNVIGWDETKKLPFAQYPLDCQLCCVCEDACPAHAITVIPDWSRKYYPAYLSAKNAAAVRAAAEEKERRAGK